MNHNSQRELPDDLESLRDIASAEGLQITGASFQNGLNGNILRARQLFQAKNNNKRTRPPWYTDVRDWMLAARDVIAMSINFVIVVLGIPISLVALFVSEILAVRLGIMTFIDEQDSLIATALSVTSIIVYFALLWYRTSILYVENNNTVEYKYSLRISFNSFLYLVGLGKTVLRVGSKADYTPWAPLVKEKKSNAKQSSSAIRWLMILIILLGVLGRLDGQAEMMNSPWHEGLINILKDSTLSELLTYLGGGLISLALLVATHFLIHFVYDAFRKAVGNTETDFFNEDESLGLGLVENQAAIQYYQAKIIAGRQARLKASGETTQTAEQAITLNGKQNSLPQPTSETTSS